MPFVADASAAPTSGFVPDAPREPSLPPRQGSGPWDALVSGVQSSGTGLALRGKLPSVVLDHTHSKWYENALETVGQMAPDLPQMVGGAVVGGLAGSAIAPGPGTIVGGGAGAFAVPAAIRESLVQAYESRDAVNSADFLTRAGIVIKETAKSALIGGATAGAGAVARRVVESAIAPAIGQTLTVGAARTAIGAAATGAEIGTVTVVPAALEGRLPEPVDFANAAIVVGGMKAAGHVAGKMATIYAKTGRTPEQQVADANSDPALKAELAGPSTDLPDAYKPLAAAEEAKAAFPGDKAQSVLDQPYANIPEARLPYTLNMKSVTGPDGLRALVSRMTEVYESDAKPQGHAETEAKADAMLNDMTGGDAVKIVTGYEAGSAANAVQLKIRGDMLMQASIEADTAIKTYNEAKVAGTATDQMKIDALDAINKSAMIQAEFTGGLTESARAVEYAKRFKELRTQSNRIQELVSMYGADPDTMLKLAGQINTPEGMAAFARLTQKATTWDKVIEAWKAGILSGPITHVANVVGNGTFMAMRPIIDMTAAIGGKLTGQAERVSAVEPFSRIFGNLQGAKDALQLAGAALRTAYEESGVKGALKEAAVGNDAGKSEQFRTAIEGTKGDIIRLPFRALSLADDFFKSMNARGERYALATRQAVKEGFNIQTREFRERVVSLVQNDAKIAEAADEAATRFTFNSPLGKAGLSVQNMVKTAHLQLLVPFIRTPANIFKEMIRLTPLAPLISEWRQSYEAGGAERAKAISEMAMGTAISAVVASYALDGSITGQLSADPNKRNVEVASGKQPYSIKIGDKWYSYQRLQPVGTLIGMAADLAEVWDHVSEHEGNKGATMLSVAFANAVTQQTFLSGITSIVQVLADPERYGSRFVQQYAGSVVPSIVAQPTAMYDPLQREIGGIVDAVKARIPGLRETLTPQINPLTGETVKAKERVGELAPVNVSDISKDKVLSEAAKLGVGISKAPKAIELPAMHQKDIGKVALAPEQRQIFSEESGALIHAVMTNAVNSPGWDEMPPLKQKLYFEKAIELGHKKGRAIAMTAEQRESEMQRIGNVLRDKLQ